MTTTVCMGKPLGDFRGSSPSQQEELVNATRGRGSKEQSFAGRTCGLGVGLSAEEGPSCSRGDPELYHPPAPPQGPGVLGRPQLYHQTSIPVVPEQGAGGAWTQLLLRAHGP